MHVRHPNERIKIEADVGHRTLVLAGAGAKGSFQAALWWDLERRGLSCDHVIGVSAGALNGAKISCGQTYPLLEVWKRTRKRDVVQGGLSLWRLLDLVRGRKHSLYDTGPLRNLLHSEYHPDDTRLPFTMGWTNYDEGGAYESLTVVPEETYTDRDRDDIISRIMASSAVPLTHPAVQVDGADCYDGGVRNITPMADALRNETDQIIVILAEPLIRSSRDVDISDIRTVGSETLGILLNEIIVNDVRTATAINRAVREHEVLIEWLLDRGMIESRDDLPDKGYLTHRTGRRLYDTDIILLQPPYTLGSGEDFSVKALNRRLQAAQNLERRISLV